MTPYSILGRVRAPEGVDAYYFILTVTGSLRKMILKARKAQAKMDRKFHGYGSIIRRGGAIQSEVLTSLPEEEGWYSPVLYEDRDIRVPENVNVQCYWDLCQGYRTECNGLEIHADSVRFTCYSKYSDTTIESTDNLEKLIFPDDEAETSAVQP